MLNFQIGKKYRRRNGTISIMTGYHDAHYSGKRAVDFDDGDPVWASSGLRSNGYENPEDIIEEVKENEMKIKVGKWYKTRNGYKAHILHKFIGDGLGNKNIIGYTTSPDGVFWDTVMWTNAGTASNPHMELIEEWKEPKSGVRYMNVYEHFTTGLSMTRLQADINAEDNGGKRLACVRVEWKEGQFDD